WMREQPLKYMHDYTALPEHEIETEVDLYIAWPGQALSYYMGELAIVRAREKAEKALGVNGADGISDIEGKATRVGASERGQRTSFKPFFRDSLTKMECQIFRSDPNSSIIRRPAIKNGSSAILWKRGRGILGSTYAREFGKHGPR